MNITLSANKSLIAKARKYAQKHNTTLNNLVREYLKKIVNNSDADKAADEFEKNALSHSCKSDRDYRFKRDDIYTEG
jgi:hypothetical protein